MNAPTAHIFAFSPPAVNGDECSVYVHGGKFHATLAGPVKVMRELARDILRRTGGLPERLTISDTPPLPTGPGRGVKLTAARLAAYERVAARVRGGASWRAAAAAENVTWKSAYEHHWRERKRAAAAARREEARP